MNVPDPTAQVSCQALQVLFDYAQGRGVSLKELQAGLSYGPEYLERGGNWVDYATLVQVERSLAAALPNEDQLFFKVGHSIGETRSLGFLRTISRTLLSPSAVYQRIPGLMRRFLFRFVDVQYERVAWNRFRGHYRFTPECPATDAFLETARGVLTSVPLMVGAPPAHVSVIRHSDLYVEIEITVTKWRGLVGFTHGWLRGVAGWGKRRKEAEIDAVAELEHTNRQLQDKIDALTTAKGELELLRDRLEDRVRERTAELEVSQGQLEDTVARLERADRAKSDFFANVSHELKTPLTLILAPLDEVLHILGERDGSLELTLPLSTAHKSAEALHQLVDELLDFASLEAGRMPLQVEPCDLAALVVDACRSLEPLARARNIGWHTEGASLPIPVTADHKLLTRAVRNLSVNAIKYCEAGDHVTTGVRETDEAWHIYVTDDGPGIELPLQARIFERFERAPDAHERAITGSGIGLAMVRDIVRMHGGEVHVSSAPGAGSTFEMTLPKVGVIGGRVGAILDASAQPDRTQKSPSADLEQTVEVTPVRELVQTRATEAVSESAGTERFDDRVLVVEDDPDLRAFLVRTIGTRHGAISAADGQQALQLVADRLPDLVLSDIMMPGMDGYELCRRLKQDPLTTNVPVILITARHGAEAAVAGFAAGADDYVPKPFSIQELQARIDTQLRLRSLTTTLIRAEKQNLLGLLSAGIAHEVLNPVNAVVNSVPHVRDFVAALTTGAEPRLDAATCGELLDAIEQAGHRIDDMVRAIVTFTRSDDGPPAMRLARPSEGIRSMLKIMRFKLRDVQVHFDFGYDEEILCHAGLIDQAVANLVVNAADELDGRPGEIWIATERDGDRMRIRVRDSGPGVPAARRAKIFEPFFTTKPPGAGTGLGLAIGREIVQMHGGTLELGAQHDRGAEFVVTLPLPLRRAAIDIDTNIDGDAP